MSHKNLELRAKSFHEFVKESVETDDVEQPQQTEEETSTSSPEQKDINPMPSPSAALAPELESVPLPNNTNQPEVATHEEPAEVIPVSPGEEPHAPISNISIGSKTVVLNGYASNIGDAHPNKSITDQIVQGDSSNVEEINLYQLNIMSVDIKDNGKEPADGMTQIYTAVDNAAVIIVSAEVKNGQISGVLQTCLERIAQHYTHQELRNKVLGTVITGKEASHEATRSTIVNFALGMGMIVGGDCNLFSVSNDTVGVHAAPDVTSFTTCINELVKATSSIRQTIQANNAHGDEPFMTYGEFDSQMSDMPVQHEEDEHDSDIGEFTKPFEEEDASQDTESQSDENTETAEESGTDESDDEVEQPVEVSDNEENAEEDEEDIMSYDKFTLDK